MRTPPRLVLIPLFLTLGSMSFSVVAFGKNKNSWTFAVSGDSRNCGDVIMPAIAKESLKKEIQFYWHLGDFRWFTSIDQDLAHDSLRKKTFTLEEYKKTIMWQDFIDSQIKPFGLTPVFLSIGNHEIQPGKTREDYVSTFRSWLDAPPIHMTHLNDEAPLKTVRPYFHWVFSGIDFISLDNATHDQFDSDQMDWFRKIVAHDENDKAIKTIVVGMHAALPESISRSHSMSELTDAVAVESGREVYLKLLHAKNSAKKSIYILASHSHFFMEGTFNTQYWKDHGGVLPGWIIGTAGAVRYALPKEASNATQAKTHVYGYLLATVDATGAIKFKFQQINKADIPSEIVHRYGDDLVTECFDKNAIDKMLGEDEKPRSSPSSSPQPSGKY